jgi:hypothetical protein
VTLKISLLLAPPALRAFSRFCSAKRTWSEKFLGTGSEGLGWMASWPVIAISLSPGANVTGGNGGVSCGMVGGKEVRAYSY